MLPIFPTFLTTSSITMPTLDFASLATTLGTFIGGIAESLFPVLAVVIGVTMVPKIIRAFV